MDNQRKYKKMKRNIQKEKMNLIFQLLNQDDNSENLLNWASCFLGSLSYKDVKNIYDREIRGKQK